MAENGFELVELTRASRGLDLFSVIEAAQFARALDHEESLAGPEAETLEAFFDRVQEYAETWDRKSAVEQTASLSRLGRHLDELARLELFV